MGPGGQMGATTWPARPVWHPDDRLFGKVTPRPSHTVGQQPLQPSSLVAAASAWASRCSMSWCGAGSVTAEPRGERVTDDPQPAQGVVGSLVGGPNRATNARH